VAALRALQACHNKIVRSEDRVRSYGVSAGAVRACNGLASPAGATENVKTENTAPSKMHGWKTGDWKTRHQCRGGGGKCGNECYGTPKMQYANAKL